MKERLFGLTNSEGNHGEDVKECYFYLDNTLTHSYMKALYKYPHRAFPYADLVAENAKRKATPSSFEYELLDTGRFSDNEYTDVMVEYAKYSPSDVLIRLSLTNRSRWFAKSNSRNGPGMIGCDNRCFSELGKIKIRTKWFGTKQTKDLNDRSAKVAFSLT